MTLIKPFKSIRPNLAAIKEKDLFFSEVKRLFNEYKDEAYFIVDETPGFYIDKIESAIRTHIGLITHTDINEYVKGNIVKHERTLAEKEEKQLSLQLERNASVKPILLTYPDVPEINALLHQYISTHNPV